MEDIFKLAVYAAIAGAAGWIGADIIGKMPWHDKNFVAFVVPTFLED